jgi:predicted dehydrogenase
VAALEIGVIGAGDIARKVHVPVLRSLPEVHLAWIYDASEARARSVARANGLRAVAPCMPHELPGCDVALIAIPVGVRDAYYEVFAERGTAVLSEKPIAVSLAAHRALTECFSPSRLGCGFMRRFYSSTQLLRSLVRTQPFGPLIRISVSEGNRSTASRMDRPYFDDPGQSAHGGILSELGCHSIDLALHVTGARIYEIESCEFVFDGSVDRKITARIRLGDSEFLTARGAVLDYEVSWLDRQTNRIVLEFEHCTAWCGTGPEASVRMGDPSRPEAAIVLSGALPLGQTANQAFALQWRSFLSGVTRGVESEISAQSAILGTELIEALYARGRQRA